MIQSETSENYDVNAAFIIQEIFIDFKWDLKRTIGQKFVLYGFDIVINRISWFSWLLTDNYDFSKGVILPKYLSAA